MRAAAALAPTLPGPATAAAQRRLFAVEPTLDIALSQRWDRLIGGAAAECLLCGGEMKPRWTAGAGVAGGRCSSCGTTLE